MNGEDNLNTDSSEPVVNDTDPVENPSEEQSEESTSPNKITPSPGSSIQFKRPLLVGPRKGVRKITTYKQPAPETPTENQNNEQPKEIEREKKDEEAEKQKKIKKSPAELIQENSTPVPYKEPKWSGLPTCSYSLEVLKSGQIVTTISLNDKSFYVFGRLVNMCDVVLAHPSISRFHAVLQFRLTGDERNPSGFYIYDLESTHGTFLNKMKIKPNMFVRVQVGHMLKFGLSTRTYILQGPEEDQEPESELSVTEMKELSLKKKLEEVAAKTEKLTEKLKEQEDGIDWGMGEDADEETDLSENPYASTQNEELYITDPKKTLRGWFEREGYDLEYNCEEKGFGQFICRVELPIDNSKGLPVIAEAVVRGKKKEAVVQCALEACRILDRYGLLRQSNHESKKRKAKNWEEDDYYDSDDDTFLDRTGAIEKKRQIRMEQAKAKEASPVVHTYQSLMEQHKKIIEEIEKIEAELEESTKKNSRDNQKLENDNEDELDAYMSNLQSVEKKDKSHVSKLRVQLLSLKQEEVKVRNLANIAKPAELPPLKPKEPEAPGEVKKPKLPIIGKRKIGTKKPIQVVRTFESEEKMDDHDSGEEVESD